MASVFLCELQVYVSRIQQSHLLLMYLPDDGSRLRLLCKGVGE
jgi:hypothetical protein